MPSERLLLVQKCQKALNNNSSRHEVGIFWVPEHSGVRGNEIADDLARGGFILGGSLDLSRPWETLDEI